MPPRTTTTSSTAEKWTSLTKSSANRSWKMATSSVHRDRLLARFNRCLLFTLSTIYRHSVIASTPSRFISATAPLLNILHELTFYILTIIFYKSNILRAIYNSIQVSIFLSHFFWPISAFKYHFVIFSLLAFHLFTKSIQVHNTSSEVTSLLHYRSSSSAVYKLHFRTLISKSRTHAIT